jgi:hypothetical protein
MTMRLLIGCVLVAAAVIASFAGAQQIGTNETQGKDTTYTLSVKSQLVTESVVVRDKQGKFVSGLMAKDFAVTEDGTRRMFASTSGWAGRRMRQRTRGRPTRTGGCWRFTST